MPLVFYMLQRRWTTTRQMEPFAVMGETLEPDHHPDPQDGDSGNKDVDMRGVGGVNKVLRVGIEPSLSVIKQPLDHGGSVVWGLQKQLDEGDDSCKGEVFFVRDRECGIS